MYKSKKEIFWQDYTFSEQSTHDKYFCYFIVKTIKLVLPTYIAKIKKLRKDVFYFVFKCLETYECS